MQLLTLRFLAFISLQVVIEKESSHYRPCYRKKSKSIHLRSEGNKEVGGSQKDEDIS